MNQRDSSLDERQHGLKVALLWHGDRQARETAALKGNRFESLADALCRLGVQAEPSVYADDFAEEVRDQLLGVHGVMVWVNPIEAGHDRTVLDDLLRQVAARGLHVSAHPDVILKMGTKEVLYRTRHMGWGCDTYLYETAQMLAEQLPKRLAEAKPRVLKQYRGQGGDGVWKIDRFGNDPERVRVRHARRGSVEEAVPVSEFLKRCESYFERSGRIIDQPYQERLTDGMVRCYLVGNKVAGFGEQLVNALYPPPPGEPLESAPQPGPRHYYPPARLDFQALRTRLEEEWLPEMQRLLDIETDVLPAIWDADFLYGPRDTSGEDTYVLCEINVSSVYPFPDEATEPLALEVRRRLQHTFVRK